MPCRRHLQKVFFTFLRPLCCPAMRPNRGAGYEDGSRQRIVGIDQTTAASLLPSNWVRSVARKHHCPLAQQLPIEIESDSRISRCPSSFHSCRYALLQFIQAKHVRTLAPKASPHRSRAFRKKHPSANPADRWAEARCSPTPFLIPIRLVSIKAAAFQSYRLSLHQHVHSTLTWRAQQDRRHQSRFWAAFTT